MTIRTATMTDLRAVTDLEAACFPAAEAATEADFAARLSAYPDHFWLLEEDGELISFIDGMVTDEPTLRDEMYENAALHDEKGVEGGREQKPAHESFDILHLKRDHRLKILLLRVKPEPRRGPRPGSRCFFLVSVYMELNRKAIHYIMASDEKGGTVP